MKHVYIIGTCDTKHTEILYVHNLLLLQGISTCIVDVGIYERMLPPDIRNVVHLREKQLDVFADITDRGKALALMGTLLEEFLVEHQKDISGVIGLGGSGNTAIVTRGMRALPVGLPKLMVSTVASGDVAPYVGASDICMMPTYRGSILLRARYWAMRPMRWRAWCNTLFPKRRKIGHSWACPCSA